MFQRFEGEMTTIDVHLLNNSVHVVLCYGIGVPKHHHEYPHDAKADAIKHFNDLCASYRFVGFDPVEVDL